jgi:hypothetical protein
MLPLTEVAIGPIALTETLDASFSAPRCDDMQAISPQSGISASVFQGEWNG